MDDTTTIESNYKALSGRLDEATLRLWAATEARSLGRGGKNRWGEKSMEKSMKSIGSD